MACPGDYPSATTYTTPDRRTDRAYPATGSSTRTTTRPTFPIREGGARFVVSGPDMAPCPRLDRYVRACRLSWLILRSE